MWETIFYILVFALLLWRIPRFFARPSRITADEEIQAKFRKALSDPVISFIVLRMIRDRPPRKNETKDERRKLQKYNLLRARLDSLVDDKEVLRRINLFVERKRNGD